MTKEEYFKKTKAIWQNHVPKSGQAENVQGELLRAVEKLRDESHRNGNINFHDGCHTLLIGFLRNKLSDGSVFDQDQILEINTDLDEISQAEHPYIEDDIYDRLCDRVVDWSLIYADMVPHKINPELKC